MVVTQLRTYECCCYCIYYLTLQTTALALDSLKQLSYPTDNCLGPGFTQTIPSRWWQYSITVLKPGDAAVYSSLSFACNGTLQSLTIPFLVRGSIYRYVDQYLYIGVSVWRFNETGYYQVREFQDRVRVTDEAFREVPENRVLWSTTSILPQMQVLAKDALAFRLLLPYNTTLGPVYQHLPFLFKPGPSPGAFIPIVTANFVASSGSVTGEECTYVYIYLLIGFKQRKLMQCVQY